MKMTITFNLNTFLDRISSLSLNDPIDEILNEKELISHFRIFISTKQQHAITSNSAILAIGNTLAEFIYPDAINNVIKDDRDSEQLISREREYDYFVQVAKQSLATLYYNSTPDDLGVFYYILFKEAKNHVNNKLDIIN